MGKRGGAFTAATGRGAPSARSSGAFSSLVKPPEVPERKQAEPPPKPKKTRPWRPARELTLVEANDFLEDLRNACGKAEFQRKLKELRHLDYGAFKKREYVAKILASFWKSALRKWGFPIDERGFPEMLAAVRAHSGTAGIRVVSHQVERQLFFQPGALFGLQAAGESSWKRAEHENVVEVTVRHVTEGDEVVISLPKTATILEALRVLANKVGRDDVVTDGALGKREDGAFSPLPDTHVLGARTSLLFDGASLRPKEAIPSVRGRKVLLDEAKGLLRALEEAIGSFDVQRRMQNLARGGGPWTQMGQNKIIREEWEPVLSDFNFPTTEMGYKSMKLSIKAYGDNEFIRLTAHEVERLCRYELGSYFEIPLGDDEKELAQAQAAAAAPAAGAEAPSPASQLPPGALPGGTGAGEAAGAAAGEASPAGCVAPASSDIEIVVKHCHSGKEVALLLPAQGTMLDVKAALVRKLGRGQVAQVRLIREMYPDGTFAQHKDSEPIGGVASVLVLGLDLNAPRAPEAGPPPEPRPGTAATDASAPEEELAAPSPPAAPAEPQAAEELPAHEPRQPGEAAAPAGAEAPEAEAPAPAASAAAPSAPRPSKPSLGTASVAPAPAAPDAAVPDATQATASEATAGGVTAAPMVTPVIENVDLTVRVVSTKKTTDSYIVVRVPSRCTMKQAEAMIHQKLMLAPEKAGKLGLFRKVGEGVFELLDLSERVGSVREIYLQPKKKAKNKTATGSREAAQTPEAAEPKEKPVAADIAVEKATEPADLSAQPVCPEGKAGEDVILKEPKTTPKVPKQDATGSKLEEEATASAPESKAKCTETKDQACKVGEEQVVTEEAEPPSREEEECKARKEEGKAGVEEDVKAKEVKEKERKARDEECTVKAEDQERNAREEEQKAREQEEEKAMEEEDRKTREEEQKAREEEKQRATELEERKARELEERMAREDAERIARELEEQKAKEEAERMARELEEQKAREEEERMAREAEEEQRKAREEEVRTARELEEQKAREEEERKASEMEERKERELEERRAREEGEERMARDEEERKRSEEEQKLREQEEEHMAREEEERKAREQEEKMEDKEGEEAKEQELAAEEKEESTSTEQEKEESAVRQVVQQNARDQEEESVAREQEEPKTRDDEEKQEEERTDREDEVEDAEKEDEQMKGADEQRAREEREEEKEEGEEKEEKGCSAMQEDVRKAPEEEDRQTEPEDEGESEASARGKPREEEKHTAEEEEEEEARDAEQVNMREEEELTAKEEAAFHAKEEDELQAGKVNERRPREDESKHVQPKEEVCEGEEHRSRPEDEPKIKEDEHCSHSDKEQCQTRSEEEQNLEEEGLDQSQTKNADEQKEETQCQAQEKEEEEEEEKCKPQDDEECRAQEEERLAKEEHLRILKEMACSDDAKETHSHQESGAAPKVLPPAVVENASEVEAVTEAASAAEAALKGPLAYEVVSDDKPVLVRARPQAQSPQLGRLLKGWKVLGVPAMGWLRLNGEGTPALDPALRGGWAFIGSRLAADFARVGVERRFAEALDLRWPGLQDVAAAYNIEWRPAACDGKAWDGGGHILTRTPEVSLHRFPPGAGAMVRVVVRAFVPGGRGGDQRLCGPWAKVTCGEAIPSKVDESPGARLDPEGQYRGGCAESNCWAYVGVAGEVRCARCGKPYQQHWNGMEDTSDLGAFTLVTLTVVREKVVVRAARSVGSRALGVLLVGGTVRGRREGEWLRLSGESIRAALLGEVDMLPAAWVLVDGSRLGQGPLLEPEGLAVPQPKQQLLLQGGGGAPGCKPAPAPPAPAGGEDRKADAVEVVFRHATKDEGELRLTLPSSFTMLQVKVALIRALGRGLVKKVQLVRKQDGILEAYQDSDRLGAVSELYVAGVHLRESRIKVVDDAGNSGGPGAEDLDAAEAERLARRKARREARRRSEQEGTNLEAERTAREEAERRAREQAEREALEAERKATEDAANAERLAAEEAERKAKKKAKREQRKAEREEAERKAKEEAERQEEAERIAREEAERKAREDAEREAAEEAERKARKKAKKEAKLKAEREAKEEAERKAKEEAETKSHEEVDRRASVETQAEREAAEEAERKARKKAKKEAKLKAEREAKEEAERKAKEEAETKSREEAGRRTSVENEMKASSLLPDETRPAVVEVPAAVCHEAAEALLTQASTLHTADGTIECQQKEGLEAKEQCDIPVEADCSAKECGLGAVVSHNEEAGDEAECEVEDARLDAAEREDASSTTGERASEDDEVISMESPRAEGELTLEEVFELLEDLGSLASEVDFQKGIDELRSRGWKSDMKVRGVAKLLSQAWKAPLKKWGFPVNGLGFTAMLSTIRSHSQTADICTASHDVERHLRLEPGALFGLRTTDESEGPLATPADTAERHAGADEGSPAEPAAPEAEAGGGAEEPRLGTDDMSGIDETEPQVRTVAEGVAAGPIERAEQAPLEAGVACEPDDGTKDKLTDGGESPADDALDTTLEVSNGEGSAELSKSDDDKGAGGVAKASTSDAASGDSWSSEGDSQETANQLVASPRDDIEEAADGLGEGAELTEVGAAKGALACKAEDTADCEVEDIVDETTEDSNSNMGKYLPESATGLKQFEMMCDPYAETNNVMRGCALPAGLFDHADEMLVPKSEEDKASNAGSGESWSDEEEAEETRKGEVDLGDSRGLDPCDAQPEEEVEEESKVADAEGEECVSEAGSGDSWSTGDGNDDGAEEVLDSCVRLVNKEYVEDVDKEVLEEEDLPPLAEHECVDREDAFAEVEEIYMQALLSLDGGRVGTATPPAEGARPVSDTDQSSLDKGSTEAAAAPQVEVIIRQTANKSGEVRLAVAANATMLQVKMALVHTLKRGQVNKIQLVNSDFAPYKDAEPLGDLRELLALGLPGQAASRGAPTGRLAQVLAKKKAAGADGPAASVSEAAEHTGAGYIEGALESDEQSDALVAELDAADAAVEGADAEAAGSTIRKLWPENTPAVIRNRLNIDKVAQSELEVTNKRIFKPPKQVLKKSWIKTEQDNDTTTSVAKQVNLKPVGRRQGQLVAAAKSPEAAAPAAAEGSAAALASPAVLRALGLGAGAGLEELLAAMCTEAYCRAEAEEALKVDTIMEVSDAEGEVPDVNGQEPEEPTAKELVKAPGGQEASVEDLVEVSVQHAISLDEVRLLVPTTATMADVLLALASKLGREDISERGRFVRHVGGSALASFSHLEPLGNQRELLLLGVDLAVGASLQACNMLVVVVPEAATTWQKRVVEAALHGLGIGRLMQQGQWLETPTDESSPKVIGDWESEGMMWLLGALPVAVPLREIPAWSVAVQSRSSVGPVRPAVAMKAADGPEFISIADETEFFIGDAEHEATASCGSRQSPWHLSRLPAPSLEEAQELLQALRQLFSHEQSSAQLKGREEPLAAFAGDGAEGFRSLLSLASVHAEEPGIREALSDVELLLHLPCGLLLDCVEVHVRHDHTKETLVVVVPKSATLLRVREAILRKLGHGELGDIQLVRREGGGAAVALADVEPLGAQRRLLALGPSFGTGGEEAAPSDGLDT